jgi:Heterokaryon incompatibility protein (HET)
MADIYSTLDPTRRDVRFLRLLPGERETPVSCTLSVASIVDARDYEALSYVWGDPKVTRPISLDGREFPVTINLESALQSLRHEDRERVMWIDAICINQQDVQERNNQVQQMGEIYANAQNVVVWLGPLNEDLDKAIDQILELGQAEHLSAIHKYKICAHEKFIDHRPEDPERMFEPLNAFIECGWFHRTWVVQEVALAREARLYCGDRHLSWDDVARFTTWLQRHAECCVVSLPSRAGFTLSKFCWRTEKLHMIRNYLALKGSTIDLSLLSSMLRERHCTDDRDRIYAFLGLIDKPIIRPNYDLSVPDLYRQIALAHIAETGTLDALSKAGRLRNHHALPFWVPDWSAHMHLNRSDFTHHLTPDLNHVHFSAAGDTQAVVRDLGPEGLQVRGIHVDTVWKTVPVVKWISPSAEGLGNRITVDFKRLKLWEKMIGVDREPERPYPGGGTLSEAYWRTLLADSVVDEPSHSARRLSPGDMEDFRTWRVRMGEGQDGKPKTPITPEDLRRVRNFNLGIQHALGDRHLFITTKGYIGIGCNEVYVGDFVCVLFGGNQPFLLRREQTYLKENEGEPYTSFSFFGAAYVNGIMAGEAMKGVNESNTLEFIIR